MNVLLVCATAGECAAIAAKLQPAQAGSYTAPSTQLYVGTIGGNAVTLLVTGIGMVNTARAMGALRLEHSGYDLLINFGIAGAFQQNLALGAVVQVVQDTYAELGSEDGADFHDLHQLGFPSLVLGTDQYYNTYGNPQPHQQRYPQVVGITVNTVAGHPATILQRTTRFSAAIETMESAAFFQMAVACDKPFLALRGISNYVEPRNKLAWRLSEAIVNVQAAVLDFLSGGDG
jgi:futalosine hydrolase